MEALGSAATIVQLISFTGEVLATGYSFLAKVKRAPLEIKNLLQETAHINKLLDQLQDLATEYGNVPAKGAVRTLEMMGIFENGAELMKIVEKTINTCQQVAGQGVRNAGKRLLWPFKEKDTKEVMIQLGRLRDTLSAAVLVDSAKMLKNLEAVAKDIDHNVITLLNGMFQIQEKIAGLNLISYAADLAHIKSVMEHQISEDQKLDICRWLYPDGINIGAAFETALGFRHPGTGIWFMQSKEFISWMLSTQSCLWVYGIAGCGKTVLSATVVDHLRTNPSGSSLVLQFFCDRRDPGKQSFQDLIHVILKELLQQNPSCFKEAKVWYDERKQLNGGRSIATPTCSEYINFIQQLCQQWNEVSLVVDAIDECSNVQSFVAGLESLTSRSNIKLLVTSRNEVETELAMTPLAKFQMCLPEHMKDDIHTFLTNETQNRVKQGSLKLRQKELAGDIVAALEAKADGMILIAKLQLDFICNLKSDRAIRAALATLPMDIYSTYDEILQQLCLKKPNEIEDLQHVLEWLAYSIVPLTLGELAEAISIRDGDEYLDELGIATDPMDLAACCGSLVTVHSQGTGKFSESTSQFKLITLSHASVEEYLRSGKMEPTLAKTFHMDSEAINLVLAKKCLQYVGFDDFEVPVKREILHDNHVTSDKLCLERRTSKYQFYDYASRHWSSHLRLAPPTKQLHDDSLDLLQWFISWESHQGQYISWQQMYHRDVFYYCPHRPPLHYAIEFKIDSLVNLLLPPDDELDKSAEEMGLILGLTPLQVAARSGAVNTIKELLHRGASVDLVGANLKTALRLAAEAGQCDAIKLLLENGASVDSMSKSGSTPFYGAARSGSIKALKMLYNAESDLNAQTSDGWTPLFEATAHGRQGIAKQLLDWGADPTVITQLGDSFLTLLKRVHNRKIPNDLPKSKTKKASHYIFITRSGHVQSSMSTSAHHEKIELSDYIVPISIESPFDPNKAITENDILTEIMRLRGIKDQGPEKFEKLFEGFEYQYLLLEKMDNDTRPGNEREKDNRWHENPSYIICRSQFMDKV